MGLLVSSPRSGQRGRAGVSLRSCRRPDIQKQSQHPHYNLHVSQMSLTVTNLDSNRKERLRTSARLGKGRHAEPERKPRTSPSSCGPLRRTDA